MTLQFNLVAVLAASMGIALAENDEPLNGDPRLLQLAEENPDATFMVIVQKDFKNKNLKAMELELELCWLEFQHMG